MPVRDGCSHRIWVDSPPSGLSRHGDSPKSDEARMKEGASIDFDQIVRSRFSPVGDDSEHSSM